MSFRDSYYNSFPQEIQDLEEQDWIDFATLLDQLDQGLIEAIDDMQSFWDLDKSSELHLPFLSYPVLANVFSGDEENIKRTKIWNGVARHREKGILDRVKEALEEVTGVEPVIFAETFAAFSIWESLGNLMPTPNDFMRWGSKNAPLDEGRGYFRWTSKTANVTGADIRGVIFINLQVEDLPAQKVEKAVKVVEYFGAVYFRYFIGVEAADGWQEYRQIY